MFTSTTPVVVPKAGSTWSRPQAFTSGWNRPQASNTWTKPQSSAGWTRPTA